MKNATTTATKTRPCSNSYYIHVYDRYSLGSSIDEMTDYSITKGKQIVQALKSCHERPWRLHGYAIKFKTQHSILRLLTKFTKRN